MTFQRGMSHPFLCGRPREAHSARAGPRELLSRTQLTRQTQMQQRQKEREKREEGELESRRQREAELENVMRDRQTGGKQRGGAGRASVRWGLLGTRARRKGATCSHVTAEPLTHTTWLITRSHPERAAVMKVCRGTACKPPRAHSYMWVTVTQVAEGW